VRQEEIAELALVHGIHDVAGSRGERHAPQVDQPKAVLGHEHSPQLEQLDHDMHTRDTYIREYDVPVTRYRRYRALD
jgi:hypothetical protein